MKLIKFLGAFSSLLLLTACATSPQQNNVSNEVEENLFTVGIIQQVEHHNLDATINGIKASLEESDLNIVIDFQNAQGDTATLSTIAQRFVNNDVDLIFAVATAAAQAVASETDTIPIIGGSLTDFEVAGLVQSNEHPMFNISGHSNRMPVFDQIEIITRFIPNLETLGIAFSSSEPNAVIQAQWAREAAMQLGIPNIEEATITNINDLQQVTTSLANRVDAIWIPNDNNFSNGITLVRQISLETGTPFFPASGNSVLVAGIATVSIDYFDLGVSTGEMGLEILLGEAEVSTMPVRFPDHFYFIVNGEMIEELGLEVPEDFLQYVIFPND